MNKGYLTLSAIKKEGFQKYTSMTDSATVLFSSFHLRNTRVPDDSVSLLQAANALIAQIVM